MTTLMKYKFLLSMMLMFAAGAASGALIAWPAAKRANAPKPPPTMERACDFMKHKLETRLHLTPEQLAKISPRVEQTAQELDEVHRKSMSEIDAVFQRSNQDIAQELTPEQQAILNEMENERRHFGPHGSPGSKHFPRDHDKKDYGKK